MQRRRLLTVVGTAALTSLAGCIDGDDGSDGETGDGGSDTVDDGSDAGDDGSDADADSVDADDTPTETQDDRADSSGETAGWPSGAYADYETAEVRVVTADGELLGEVNAALALTGEQRYLGLSDAESLPSDGGMLFVYESVADRTFVMRRMDFGIDIIYADDEGVITEIHHAPRPGPEEDGNDQRYPGRGQYVLEVGYRWTVDHGVGLGDRIEFGR